ncbi:MAG: AMP-binding protein, partial [Proteobacteria bacterium]|nr:AMP-binding protein [Pseudomonadota bacterium]
YFATRGLIPAGGVLGGVSDFLATFTGWRILFDLLLISISGGLYSVPLYAILQHESDPAHRSRTIAANNIMNALFIVAGALTISALLAAGMTIPAIFLGLAAVNLLVAFYIIKLVPEAVVKALLKSVLKLLYRVEVKGLDHYRDAGPRAVIVVNHVSFLDAVLLAVFLPRKPLFAVNTRIAEKWWMKPFLSLSEAFAMDPTNPMAIKSLVRLVQQDRHCVIFPEGRITVTGALMKIYEGPGLIADKADAMLVPVRIDGAQYTRFSRLGGILRQRRFPKITLTILPPRRFDIPAEIKGRARRQAASVKLYDVMTDMIFQTCDYQTTLFEALVDARSVHGGRVPIVEDVERKPLSYNRLIMGAHVLGRKIAAFTKPGEHVGLLLPNASATVASFFGLQALGRVPAMLNFSTGAKNMVSALGAAEIISVVTSRRFIDAAKLEDTIAELALHADIVYLEDIRDRIGLVDKLAGILGWFWPNRQVRALGVKPTDPAVILFTSGSEGTPKGVVLSHENLLANRQQLAARIDFNPTDIVFNALPIFHSFGMTGGMLLPVLSGIRTFLYPSPLHYRIVPALVYDTNATIIFGTDTFLSGYGRTAHPYDFYSVRYVFAGAEKVKEETRRSWSDKFGLRIMEGYGATETSPVLAVNTPMHFQAGSVGRFLPGIGYRLDPVPGIDEGGRLVVSGPNIMSGYLRAENPGVLEPPEEGLYDTGDIVDVDADGYVTILGRAKRFAKIAGEMVSLTAVETYAAELWPGFMHAVVSIPDARKGEQLILVTEHGDASRDDLQAFAQANGIAEIMMPRSLHVTDKIPVLGTGKVDYAGTLLLVQGAGS